MRMQTLLAQELDEVSEDCVVLSTIHSAKGLEYPAVFVLRCNVGHLPRYYWARKDWPIPMIPPDASSMLTVQQASPGAGRDAQCCTHELRMLSLSAIHLACPAAGSVSTVLIDQALPSC